MNETERKVYLEQFNRRTHVLGRAVCVITLVLLVGAPFLIGTFLGAMPDMGAVGKGFLSVGVVWAVASVAEFLIYTPMLGAGGGYLAFITGNLINMKIPCAVNARDIAGTKTRAAEPRAPAGVCKRRPRALRRDGVSVFPQEHPRRHCTAGHDERAVHARPVADGLDQLHDRSERRAGHRHRLRALP